MSIFIDVLKHWTCHFFWKRFNRRHGKSIIVIIVFRQMSEFFFVSPPSFQSIDISWFVRQFPLRIKHFILTKPYYRVTNNARLEDCEYEVRLGNQWIQMCVWKKYPSIAEGLQSYYEQRIWKMQRYLNNSKQTFFTLQFTHTSEGILIICAMIIINCIPYFYWFRDRTRYALPFRT